jgi:hypothetical protein
MKTTAFILFSLFSLFNLQPMLLHDLCIEQIEASVKETACCSEEGSCNMEATETTDKTSSDDCSDHGVCNPFMACFCCYYLPNGVIGMEPPFLMDGSVAIRSVNEHILSNYPADCWHPPELV